MTQTAIRIEGLSKRYRIGERHRYLALRDALAHSLAAPLRWLHAGNGGRNGSRRANGNGGANEDFIWSLKDVSLEMREGETVGIIGRNGAGKTTLLKILARVTRPTAGLAAVRGRIGSLLEVGTGFHPELTGRENIFLNGAILGMSRREIAAKFDAMVDFSGVERFLDTPLKHYSSGMQLRLAFSVAAHLEPEILLVDEVLAVGDVQFQKKCLGKMKDVAAAGRTGVVVSHQLNQVRRLCERVVWLDGGRVRMNGPTAAVVAAYESAMLEDSAAQPARPSERARFLGWKVMGEGSAPSCEVSTLAPQELQFSVQVFAPARQVNLGIALRAADGELAWAWEARDLAFEPGRHELSFRFPMLPLRPGVYSWMIGLWDAQSCLDLWYAVPSMMVSLPSYQHPLDEWNGLVNVPCELHVARHS
jgi:lipopolysaccharide transport system ATP-binding protein